MKATHFVGSASCPMKRPTNLQRSLQVVAVALAAAVTAVGCVAAGGSSTPSPAARSPVLAPPTPTTEQTPAADVAASDAWWYWLGFGGIWGRSFDSLEGLVKGADAVVIDRIVQAGPGPIEGEISPDGWDDRVFYVDARIDVEGIIAGRLPGPSVVVRILSPNPAIFADQLRQFPNERAIFFLTDLYRALTEDDQNSPGPELEALRGIYEWTIPGAVVREFGGIARPLLELTGQRYLVGLDGRPFDEVVATVADLAN